jgi:hypothetical protein
MKSKKDTLPKYSAEEQFRTQEGNANDPGVLEKVLHFATTGADALATRRLSEY